MEIMIKLASFRGGAPLSMRAYQQVLKSEGHNVSVCGNMKDGQEKENAFYEDTPCYHIDTCNERSIFSVVKTSLSLFSLMKNQRTRLLMSTSRNDFGVCYAVCRATGANFIPIIPGGKIGEHAKNLSSVRKEKFICFSLENKDDLLINGISESDITVIPNRIQVMPDFDWLSHYSRLSEDTPLKILLVTRLDPSLIKGVLSFIDTIASFDGNIELSVAGDGSCADEFREYVEKINGKKCVIRILGFVKDMNSIILQSDVIVGKGRSVITPIMMNRIGFVLGYDGGITICNEENFSELFRYNFSGRSSTKILSQKEFNAICKKIQSDIEFVKKFEHVSMIMRETYSVDYLPSKIVPFIDGVKCNQVNPKYGFVQKAKAVFYSFSVYAKWLWESIVFRRNG